MRHTDTMTVDIGTPVKLTRNRIDAASSAAHVRVFDGPIPDQDRDDIARKVGAKRGRS